MTWRWRPPDERPGYRPRHTNAQRLTLVASIVTIAICLAGGVGLLVAKHLREQVQLVTIDSTTSTTRPLANIVVSDTDPPTGDTLITSPVGTSAPTGPATEPSGPSTTTTTTPPEPTTPETYPRVDPFARNFLVAAADNHACVDPGSPWASAADPDRPASDRSDTIMVIRVDPTTNRVAVLSFPRDLWVRIPGRGSQRINAAYRTNEPDRLIQTLAENFGVPVDHYIQVDFCAFKRIVEAVGGLDMSFATGIRDDATDLRIENPGCHHFVGDEALAYVRSRHLRPRLPNGKWGPEDPASDLARISRQQDFLSRVLAKALDKGLLNPSVARGLIDTLTKGDIVMSRLSVDDLLGFAGVLRNVDPNQIRRYTIESKGTMIGGAAVQVWKDTIDRESMQAILRIFRGEARLEATPAPGPAISPPTPSATPGTAGVPVATSGTEPLDNVSKAILPEAGVSC